MSKSIDKKALSISLSRDSDSDNDSLRKKTPTPSKDSAHSDKSKSSSIIHKIKSAFKSTPSSNSQDRNSRADQVR